MEPLAGVAYEDHSAEVLTPGSVLLIGTDGIWEMRSPAGDQYGKKRLRALIGAHHSSSAKDLAAALESDLAAFRGVRPPEDDVTFVIVKRRA